jgi:hypothetical protein
MFYIIKLQFEVWHIELSERNGIFWFYKTILPCLHIYIVTNGGQDGCYVKVTLSLALVKRGFK